MHPQAQQNSGSQPGHWAHTSSLEIFQIDQLRQTPFPRFLRRRVLQHQPEDLLNADGSSLRNGIGDDEGIHSAVAVALPSCHHALLCYKCPAQLCYIQTPAYYIVVRQFPLDGPQVLYDAMELLRVSTQLALCMLSSGCRQGGRFPRHAHSERAMQLPSSRPMQS